MLKIARNSELLFKIVVSFLFGLFVIQAQAIASPPVAAKDAYLSGDYTKVVAMLPRQSQAPGSRLLRARSLLNLKQFKAAQKELFALDTMLPHLKDFIFLLEARAARGLKNYSAAGQFYNLVITAPASRWVDIAREERAETLIENRSFSAAIFAHRELIKSAPNHPRIAELKFTLAKALLYQEKYNDAAKYFIAVYLKYPLSSVATRAKEEFDRIDEKYKKKLSPTPEALFERAHLLYRGKRWDESIGQLDIIAKENPVLKNKVRWKKAWIFWKANRIAEALVQTEALLKTNSPAWQRLARKHKARCLGRIGKIDEAYQLYKDAIPKPKEKITARHRKTLSEVGELLAAHGRYKEALKHYDRLAKLLKWSRFLKQKTTWLAFRSGDYERAAQGFERYYRSKSQRAFSSYWQARAFELAGNWPKAKEKYEDVLEHHFRSYYGYAARTRLAEKGIVQLVPSSCSNLEGATKSPIKPMLDTIINEFGEDLPNLLAFRTLWSTGMQDEARRHLRLAMLRYAHAVYRNHLAFRIRSTPLRIWRGSPNRAKISRKTMTNLRKAKKLLEPQLGQLAYSAGLDYFGWKFSPRAEDPTRRLYPLAWADIIKETAERYNINPILLWAIMRTESSYRSDVISRVNAGGLMQLMPTTARRLASELKLKNFYLESIFTPKMNLRLAGLYMRNVFKKFQGQIPLIAAAYNGGPHNVGRWLDIRGKNSKMDEFIEEIPYNESRRYAKKIVRLMGLYERTYCEKDDRVVSNALITSYLPHPNY